MYLSLRRIATNPIFILIVLIVLLVIVSILILFSQNRPKKTTSQSPSLQNGKYSTIYHFDNAKPDTSKGTVEAKSEIKGQMVEILSKKNLIDLLDNWGVFGKKYNLGGNGENLSGVKKVIFILTDKKQKNNPLNESNNQEQISIDMYAKGNELDIKVYASSDALKRANDFFTNQALYMLYVESHPDIKNISLDKFQSDYIALIKKATTAQPRFVVYQVGYK
jgi:hypothetical protein